MKRQFRFHMFVAAAAAIVPFGLAHANDFVITGETGYFQQAAAMRKTPDLLTEQGGHVVKNSLGWEFTFYGNNPAGAQGPIREEAAPDMFAGPSPDQAFWDSLYPIGGQNTP